MGRMSFPLTVLPQGCVNPPALCLHTAPGPGLSGDPCTGRHTDVIVFLGPHEREAARGLEVLVGHVPPEGGGSGMSVRAWKSEAC